MTDETYVCPQCGPDPRCPEVHAEDRHTLAFSLHPVDFLPTKQAERDANSVDIRLEILHNMRVGLTPEQRVVFNNYLIGVLAVHVNTSDWRDGLAIALHCTDIDPEFKFPVVGVDV